jgi:ABC-type nickel/cobalt efflux system permease component RcnA
MSPGHGKTVAAAYLVGSRGTAWHAALLGLTVTISHTFGVVLLLALVLLAREYFFPEQIYPWLGFGSGLMIVVVGLALAAQRGRPLWAAWRRRAAQLAHDRAPALRLSHPHTSAPAEHLALAVAGAPSADRALAGPHLQPLGAAGHGHEHDLETGRGDEHPHEHPHDHNRDHDHGHAHRHAAAIHTHPDGTHSHGPFGTPHSHLPPDGQKVTVGSLLALGISGGIIPCPSALVVALAAVRVGRVAEGLVLLLAFSAGLAVVLTVIGLLMVYARRFIDRLPFNGRALQPLGVLSALLVAALGLILAISSLTGSGGLRF